MLVLTQREILHAAVIVNGIMTLLVEILDYAVFLAYIRSQSINCITVGNQVVPLLQILLFQLRYNILRTGLKPGINIKRHTKYRCGHNQQNPHQLEARVKSGIEKINDYNNRKDTENIIGNQYLGSDYNKTAKQNKPLYQNKQYENCCSSEEDLPESSDFFLHISLIRAM